MDIENLMEVTTRQELRDWLEENSRTKNYCWLIVSIKEQTGVIQYLDAVEEALCFGWIDGIKKNVSDGKLAQRLSPRNHNSNWTELNKERARRLIKLGLMKEDGLKVLPKMINESFTIDKDILDLIKKDKQIYNNFIQFPDLYIRIRIDTIQSYKKQPNIYNNRLEKFIENTKKNIMYGQWNDNGRLIDY
ncbi:YdeI/OmpD-associated family protein [Bacillus sp. B1-b2]|uniref:YdeI/OmpD-associated family protein n=1 Tax=Bacillus sp. B1-b2 TaxID=2653201 RepID=UPI0012625959|nr:YdeI/OmpD-associated family protein [Bacillus sp. B1-b2]KAB7672040.1 thymidylate synthase [Bacillus sp. B1-b2]